MDHKEGHRTRRGVLRVGIAVLFLGLAVVWAVRLILSDPARFDREFDGGSLIEGEELSELQTANLALLGEVWGFAKYHHPRVTGGNVHWDYELFRVMPGVLAATSREEATRHITGWLRSFGELSPCPGYHPLPSNLYLSPNTAWIHEDGRLGPDLSSLLQLIHDNRPTGRRQHYVSHTRLVGNPTFRRERSYPGLQSPDAGFRLLALFRFWNVIEYWYPYRYMIGESWKAVLEEYVPKLMAADGVVEYRAEMMSLVARVNDSHAQAFPHRPPLGGGQIPVRLTFLDGQPVVADYSHPEHGPDTGLMPGDVLLEVGGNPVDSLMAAWAPYYGASNDAARFRDLAASLARGPIDTVTIAIDRMGESIDLVVSRVPLVRIGLAQDRRADHGTDALQMLPGDVAYLRLSGVRRSEVRGHLRTLEGARALIVDLRDRPRDFLVFALGERLVDEPAEFARPTRSFASSPGAFAWGDPEVLTPGGPAFTGRLVILVDERTQSHAEYMAMALMASARAVVVGHPTAGANGNVSEIPLPGGITASISGVGVYFPDGRPMQRVGITPDVVVRRTVEGIRAGRDEVLEAGHKCAINPTCRDDDQTFDVR